MSEGGGRVVHARIDRGPHIESLCTRYLHPEAIVTTDLRRVTCPACLDLIERQMDLSRLALSQL